MHGFSDTDFHEISFYLWWRHDSLICDVTRTRGTGNVTSYSSIVLSRANVTLTSINNREYRFPATRYSRFSVEESSLFYLGNSIVP